MGWVWGDQRSKYRCGGGAEVIIKEKRPKGSNPKGA